jgi:Transmembrane secretion effector
MGGQAVGSAVWGVLASVTSLSVAMEIAAGLLFLGGLSVSVLPLHDGAVLDRSVVHFWAEPVLMFEPRPTDGPVLVTVEYRVPADRHARVHPRHGGGRAVPPAYRRQPLGTVPGHCRSRPVHLATGEPVVRHAIQPEPA